MFANLRKAGTALAASVAILAQRVSSEPRHPGQDRIPYVSRTVAGVAVTPDTAITVSAVWGCLKYISESIASLPWHVFEESDAGATMQRSNPIDWLINKRPNPEWSSFQLRETLLHWAMRYGNGYAEIERDLQGRPFALWPIHPDRVQTCRDPVTGALYYEVSNGTQGTVNLEARDMFHIRGFGEGPVGVNVIQYAAQSIGWARAAQLFGASIFGNGATPSVVVKNKKPLGIAGLKKQRAEFQKLYGGPNNANRTAHLDNDASIETISLDAEKTQLVAVHQFLVAEVCRWFGVPPHIVAELSRSTNNNIEQQSIEAVTRCLMPWVKRLEDEADFKFFGQSRRNYFTKINMMAILRGDAKSQAEAFQIYRNIGVYNADEIRTRLDENRIGPAKGGDKYLVNGATTTLEQAGALMAPDPKPAEPKPDTDPPLDKSAQKAMAQFWAIMNGATEHV